MKLLLKSTLLTCIWLIISLYFAIGWIYDIANVSNIYLAILAVSGISLIPGLAMAFVYSTLLLYKKSAKSKLNYNGDVTILVPCYNEEEGIVNTLESIHNQTYDGCINAVVCNDGSTDNSAKLIDDYISHITKYKHLYESFGKFTFTHLNLKKNVGKASALNSALANITDDIMITVDGDTTLHPSAIQNIVNRLVYNDENVTAVAGSVLVRNTNDTVMSKMQYWDYLIGINPIKMAQSAYKGVLVAQGAFSAYKTKIIQNIGGWDDTLGEDIVLTWDMLSKGYRTDYEPDAISFTSVPTVYTQFFKQRKRWSIGLIEAFQRNKLIMLNFKTYYPFVLYNFLFPFLDVSFMFIFIPAIFLAIIFKYYLLVGFLTLFILPLGILLSTFAYNRQKKILKRNNLQIEKNRIGFILFVLFYQLIQTPSTLYGYISEIFNFKKSWGTKD